MARDIVHDIIAEDFPYTVEQFCEHVAQVREAMNWQPQVAFAKVAGVWALHTNKWVLPTLSRNQFYQIIAAASLTYIIEI